MPYFQQLYQRKLQTEFYILLQLTSIPFFDLLHLLVECRKWLNSKELAHYLGYSEDKIHKIKKTEWIENIHFFKPTGKLIFSKEKIDKWVVGGSDINVDKIIGDALCGPFKLS